MLCHKITNTLTSTDTFKSFRKINDHHYHGHYRHRSHRDYQYHRYHDLHCRCSHFYKSEDLNMFI